MRPIRNIGICKTTPVATIIEPHQNEIALNGVAKRDSRVVTVQAVALQSSSFSKLPEKLSDLFSCLHSVGVARLSLTIRARRLLKNHPAATNRHSRPSKNKHTKRRLPTTITPQSHIARLLSITERAIIKPAESTRRKRTRIQNAQMNPPRLPIANRRIKSRKT